METFSSYIFQIEWLRNICCEVNNLVTFCWAKLSVNHWWLNWMELLRIQCPGQMPCISYERNTAYCASFECLGAFSWVKSRVKLYNFRSDGVPTHVVPPPFLKLRKVAGVDLRSIFGIIWQEDFCVSARYSGRTPRLPILFWRLKQRWGRVGGVPP